MGVSGDMRMIKARPQPTPFAPYWPASGAAIMAGETFHARKGRLQNAFRYGVDYVLMRIKPESPKRSRILRRCGPALMGLFDKDHGREGIAMSAWARECAARFGLPDEACAEIWLLTQPRTLGFVFNPVSFWFFRDANGHVRAVVAEVNNTFGDRHSYFCARPDFQPLRKSDEIEAAKVFHVSPFQEVGGRYHFTFRIAGDSIGIRIDHQHGEHGLLATLEGSLAPMTERGLLAMLGRYPLGALRVFGLIHWQALRLRLKGARYRTRPQPPLEEVSR
jgi:DUF1365 family protein